MATEEQYAALAASFGLPLPHNTAAEHQIGPHPGRLVAHHLSDFLNMLMPTA
jgi:hypothetical protein